MRAALVLFTSILLSLASVTVVHACDHVAYGTVQTGYVYQDNGVLATDQPVFQGGTTAICGKFSYDLWTSTLLSTKGQYGERGYGDEIDLTVNYDTKIGNYTVQASGAYYVSARFSRIKDDFGQVYVRVGRPLSFGSATVTPYVQPMAWIGIKTVPNTALVRTGLAFNMPLSSHWSVGGDASKTFELTDHFSTARGEFDITHKVGTWNIVASVKATERRKPLYGLGFNTTF